MIDSKLTITIERPAYGGIFMGRHKGRVVMIEGAVLPGETVVVAIEKEKKDYLAGSVLSVLEPSPERIRPLCRYFGECGGCHFQHVPYSLQVHLKEEVLRDCLKRLAKLETDFSAPIISNNSWNYRLRGQFKVSQKGIGFYRRNTREVVDIDNCPLMVKGINESFRKAKSLLNRLCVKEIHITIGDSPVALIKARQDNKSITYWNSTASSLMNAGFSGVSVETINGGLLHYGSRYTMFNLSDLKYTVSPMSFFQSHWKLNNDVVKFIKDGLAPLKSRNILDLYAGAGNFSLPLASDAEVVAIEENPFAIEDGKRNQQINNINNYYFIRSSAENFRSENKYDGIILDPPRPGLTKDAMSNVLSLQPEKIVYISCNPTTFARDLKKLLSKYDVESIRMIDFFPQTHHIEALAFLKMR